MKKIVSIFLVLIWMMMIFNFSNAGGNESSSLSDTLIEHVVVIFTDIEKGTEEMHEMVENLSFPIRKAAHFGVYFILGFLIMNALYINGITKRTLIISAIIAILYAVLDEFHQTFVDGRSGQISDVLLDSSAALIASYLFHKLIIMRSIYGKKNN